MLQTRILQLFLVFCMSWHDFTYCMIVDPFILFSWWIYLDLLVYMEPQCKWVMGLSGFICVLIWFYEFSVCECAWCAQWACLRRFANLRQKNTPGILKHVPCIMNPFLLLLAWCGQCACLRRFADLRKKARPWSCGVCTFVFYRFFNVFWRLECHL